MCAKLEKINMNKKMETYVSPEAEVIEVVPEGVICYSGYSPDSDDVEF